MSLISQRNAFNHRVVTGLQVLFLVPYTSFFFRDVSQSQPKEAFVQVGKKKKLMRCLEFTEEKIIPTILLFFSLLYWTYALTVYLYED